MATIIDRLKYRYKNGDVLVKFVFINAAVFLILKVVGIFFVLFNI
ncbi:MAG TPA: rhomboid family intramembrane serine protease, partial [Porphyromonadaceae bacterium]|nr:rhomboid family intramembrane serine protease [Porphyromonadaceae bacterium]